MAFKKRTKKVKTQKKSQKSSAWPKKLNVLFRPERLKYVRKINRPSGCVFCVASENEMSLETLCVYKSRYTQILLNKYPYNSGHLLVVPLAHVGDMLTLSPERYEDLHLTLRLAIQAIQEIYQPPGYNVGLNNGSAAGAGIPDHLHYHLVPRWSGDLNFFPLIAETKVVIETLDESYKKFSDYFSQIKVKS